MTGASMLVAEQVTVKFGGNLALTDVSIDARVGEVTGLIGPNGAGKTTLFNVITGMLAPTGGRIILDGRDVSRLDTHKRARIGIARTFQRLELFTDLSIRDNLRVAGEIRNTWGELAGRVGRGPRRINVARETERVLALIGLADRANADVSTIPTGTARLVELGRALMIQPRVLLLDEPASGQSDDETKAFERLLRRLAREDGLTVLLVEHDMALVMEVCDRIHVLDFGEVIAAGTPTEIRNDPRVREAYLGAATP
ncbi:MAG: branched-chain amino acid transport system ATP-binding protein [Actinomycetota bacterium]|nr:branched-chain amino acid transport system ATP-binding protein [Actinomycetota bacterium]